MEFGDESEPHGELVHAVETAGADAGGEGVCNSGNSFKAEVVL